MPLSVNPVLPVIAPQSATQTVTLQPGSVVNAQVIAALEANIVRIAIGGIAIEAATQVPLQVGAALQLAVSQTADGIRLTIVPDSATASAATSASAATPGGVSQATDTSAIAGPRTVAEAPASTLTPAQAAAVSVAEQTAAARQTGLSTLFADTAAAVKMLPAPLQQAALQLLATRPALTTSLQGGDIKSAFQNSGLFLESSLASGSLGASQSGVPDLKAALLVFRQTLSGFADTASSATAPQPGTTAQAGVPPTVESLPLAPDTGTEEAFLPKALLPVAEELVQAGGTIEILPPAGQGVGQAAALTLLQEVEAALVPGATDALKAGGSTTDNGVARTDVPPPPYRGAAPAPQAVATSSLAANATASDAIHRLADDTEGAIARQTLLQIASLPGGDTPGIDRTMPRWNFEVPFATPQGTAVAQFEISRDGGGNTASPAAKVWRARFSLNVEPTGPIHAIVSLTGGTTSVRMWAERPQTAAQLRDNAPQLNRALREAELAPGDIVIGEGAPPQPAMAPAGHFLDRAT